jgi:CDP-diacylglycerol--glycerol-3-phosphate 3-phosphatidyltransferase
MKSLRLKIDYQLSKLEPNKITTLRLGLTPLALGLLLIGSPWSLIFCLAVMTIIESTDFLDGYIARKYGKVSDWGKVYDPMCDAVYHVVMYVGLIIFFPDKFFAIAVAIISFREICIAYLRIYASIRGLVLAAAMIGKIKAVMQMISIFICVCWILLNEIFGSVIIVVIFYYLSIIGVSLALIFTLISLAYYGSFIKKNLL